MAKIKDRAQQSNDDMRTKHEEEKLLVEPRRGM